MIDALTGTLLAGRYQLFERLEETPTVLAYRGQDRRLGSACRVVVPQLEARAAFGSFERTWRLLGGLSSPHLAAMTEQGRLGGGRPYVVFGWVEGRTLQAILQSEGAQSARRAADICQAVLMALRVAHQHGIVHRDITPANVVVGHGADAGVIKLVGFAGAPRDGIDAQAVTGDAHAQAPERFVTPSVATPLTDLYAVGVLLYTLLAGHPPFVPAAAAVGVDDTEKLAWLHAHATPECPNTGVPEALWRLTESLLAKRPSDRPPSADAVLNALRTTGQTSAPPPFVTGDASLSGDPFQSAELSMSVPVDPPPDPFNIDMSMGSVNVVRTASDDEDATIADGPALLDDDEEPTVQSAAPALAVAASMFFKDGAAPKRSIDPFAHTLAASNAPEEIEAEASASLSAGRSVDRLAALVERDPLAIEAEHDSINSDILDELTVPDRAAHMRAILRPKPSPSARQTPAEKPTQKRQPARAIDDDQPTVPRREQAAIPEVTREPILKPPASVDLSADLHSAEMTRGGRPSNRLPPVSDPLARVPDVSAFSDPAPDEISTIAAPQRPHPAPQSAQDPAPRPAAASPSEAPATTVIAPKRPLNLPDQQRAQRLIGIAIGVAALLVLVSGLMWFTKEADTSAAPASEARPPVRQSIGE